MRQVKRKCPLTGRMVTPVVNDIDRVPGIDECRTKLKELSSAYHALESRHCIAADRIRASYKRYARALTAHTGESVCPIYLTR